MSKTKETKGFWFDPVIMKLVVGYFESESNLHYARIDPDGSMVFYKSSAHLGTDLIPVPFELGLRILLTRRKLVGICSNGAALTETLKSTMFVFANETEINPHELGEYVIAEFQNQINKQGKE
jgi:hypothetical protein